MAEVAVFGICSVVLSAIASPAVRSAYEKRKLARRAHTDLDKLEERIGTIEAKLLDAEKKQSNPEVKRWITRVQDVLYDADDLFDEIATDEILKKARKVRDSPFIFFICFGRRTTSKKSIAKRVKDIGKGLDELATLMGQFNFIDSSPETVTSGPMGRNYPGFLFGGSENVIGRAKEKKAVLEMVLGQSNNDARQEVSVLAIVGIGGMGKTTLAHFVYEDDNVQKRFKKKRWFVSISDTTVDKEFVSKIYLSITEGNERDLPPENVQQNKIREALQQEEFLLVLDNVWDEDRGNWHYRMGNLLRGGRKGGKIIVTTRSESVAKAVGVQETCILGGLSEEESWDLLKRIVKFTPEQEKDDSEWTILGRKIVKKAKNAPLAIKSIASLLSEKDTIEEWRSLSNEELPKLGPNKTNEIMRVLKFSYDHLSPTLKRCFAYLSLFPMDYPFGQSNLTYLWFSQGYVVATGDDQSIENEGFNDLVRRSFLQPHYYKGGQVSYWKMHDLLHELAQDVAGDESLILKTPSTEATRYHRHLTVTFYKDNSWLDEHSMSNFNRLRSFLYVGSGTLDIRRSILSVGSRTSDILRSALYLGSGTSDFKLSIERLLPKFKCLRALSLTSLGIEIVPHSIGELKHLRYLDLSWNPFKKLPDSITTLVNLCFLDILMCKELEVLPSDFRLLTNIRSLRSDHCDRLKGMPPGLEELTYLKDMTTFHVSRETKRSKLDVLHMLKLEGYLEIAFHDETDDWNETEFLQPPPNLKTLFIAGYKGPRIPKWGNEPKPMITSLSLYSCSGVKCLPPLSHLPYLISINVQSLHNLEYVQPEGDEEANAVLPNLNKITLLYLDKLVCWSRKLENRHDVTFPSVHQLQITNCPNLNHFPSCPNLKSLILDSVKANTVLHQHHNSSPLSSLRYVSLLSCEDMVIFPGESLTSLRTLIIMRSNRLEKVELPPLQLNNLAELSLEDCPKLELWDENTRGVDWDSLSKLTNLMLPNPPPPNLPDCLQQRLQRGILNLQFWNPASQIVSPPLRYLAPYRDRADAKRYEEMKSVLLGYLGYRGA